MTKKTKSLNTQKLILTGDPGKDFSTFLNAEDKFKNFNYGLNLIKNHTRNHRLYLRIKEIHKANPDLALEKLVLNLNVISYKWKK